MDTALVPYRTARLLAQYEVRNFPAPTTDRTVKAMTRYALEGRKSIAVRRIAEEICAKLDQKNYLSELVALYHWVCQHIRYMRDPVGVELVKSPHRVIDTGAGDCDDIATLVAALAMSAGATVRFVTVGFHDGPNVPEYEHVFCEAWDPMSRRWVVMDPVAECRTRQMLGRIRRLKEYPVQEQEGIDV